LGSQSGCLSEKQKIHGIRILGLSKSFGSGLNKKQLSGPSLLPPVRNCCAIVMLVDLWSGRTFSFPIPRSCLVLSAKVCRCAENAAKSTGIVSFACPLEFGLRHLPPLTAPIINCWPIFLPENLRIFRTVSAGRNPTDFYPQLIIAKR